MNIQKSKIIAALIIALTIADFVSCASTDTTDTNDDIVKIGESSPVLSGTRWEYSEDGDNLSIYYIELDEDGNAIWYDSANKIVPHLTAGSKWSREGNTINISHNSGFRDIEGTLLSGNNPRKITGIGKNKQRKAWKFTMTEK